MKTCKTVGELIEYLKNFDKDMLIMKVENHIEKGENLTSLYVHESQFIEKEIHCFDSFDGCSYNTVVKRENFNSEVKGTSCLIV